MAEVEYGGIKVGGSKLLLIIPLIGTLGGGLWAGFEFYKDYMDMKEQIQEYVAPDLSEFDKKIAIIEEHQKTVEAHMDFVEEELALFKDNNTQVIGISKDSVASHKNFCEKYQLKISLLSDPHLKLIKYFGVWQEKRNYSKTYMGIVRSTFLLDEKATIVTSWKNIKVKGHVDKVLLEVMP